MGFVSIALELLDHGCSREQFQLRFKPNDATREVLDLLLLNLHRRVYFSPCKSMCCRRPQQLYKIVAKSAVFRDRIKNHYCYYINVVKSRHVEVFADPFALTVQDRIENAERRRRTLGMAGGCLLLLVAHVVGEDEDGTEVIGIISARKADRKQRMRYEQDR